MADLHGIYSCDLMMGFQKVTLLQKAYLLGGDGQVNPQMEIDNFMFFHDWSLVPPNNHGKLKKKVMSSKPS